jgi:uncharacterized protein YqeY
MNVIGRLAGGVMGLKDRIQEDIKTAMKSKDAARLSVLRMVMADIKNRQAQVNLREELAEDEVLKVVGAYQKKLTKSLEEYPAGDARNALLGEIKVVEEYLPKKASEEETRAAVDKVLAATADRNMGSIMKLVMAELNGAGDGRLVSQLIKDKIS